MIEREQWNVRFSLPSETFNSDISKWNVASVSNMASVRSRFLRSIAFMRGVWAVL